MKMENNSQCERVSPGGKKAGVDGLISHQAQRPLQWALHKWAGLWAITLALWHTFLIQLALSLTFIAVFIG